MSDLPITRIEWRPCYRIVPSRFPPVGLFDAVADPDDLEAVFQVEAMTNDRLRDEVGEISLVPPEDRVSGPGTTPIMAAFTHLKPDGDRFIDHLMDILALVCTGMEFKSPSLSIAWCAKPSMGQIRAQWTWHTATVIPETTGLITSAGQRGGKTWTIHSRTEPVLGESGMAPQS